MTTFAQEAIALALADRDAAFELMDKADRAKWETNVINGAIIATAGIGRPFSANDVRELLPEVNTNRIGRCFAEAARVGVIEWHGMVRSTDRRTRGHRINVWRMGPNYPSTESSHS